MSFDKLFDGSDAHLIGGDVGPSDTSEYYEAIAIKTEKMVKDEFNPERSGEMLAPYPSGPKRAFNQWAIGNIWPFHDPESDRMRRRCELAFMAGVEFGGKGFSQNSNDDCADN